MPHLVLPGLGGSGQGHWQRWWLAEVPRSRLVEQADWHNPDLEAWMTNVATALEEHPGAILVAHSLACALVAHLPSRRPDLLVGGALLVAPADVDDRMRVPRAESFAPLPLSPLPFPSIVVGSSNDPFVSIGRAMLFSHAWGSNSCISAMPATSTSQADMAPGRTACAWRTGWPERVRRPGARAFSWCSPARMGLFERCFETG